MKQILRIKPVVLFEMEENENKEEAVSRFVNIMESEGLEILETEFAVIEED